MNQGTERLAVVLLSGGLDSATTLAIARRDGYAVHALSFDYGQRHRFELQAARRVAAALGAVEHQIVQIDLSEKGGFGHSALTDDIAVPKDRIVPSLHVAAGPDSELEGGEEDSGGRAGGEIPITYVPARNTIFLSIALGYAEVLGAFDIFIGVNAIDYSGYPDCRGEFIRAFETMANLATAAAVQGRGRYTIHTPLIKMTKAKIIRTGLDLGVDYSLTHSCYDPRPGGQSCGRCDSCLLRLAGFAAAGVKDPVKYGV